MRKFFFEISEKEKKAILEMHRNAIKLNYNKLSLLNESKQTELQSKVILSKNGVSEDNIESIVNQFKEGDKSKNQINLTLMSFIYVKTRSENNPNPNLNDIIRIVNEYEELVEKNRVKKYQIKGSELYLNDKAVSGNLIEFSNIIHGIQSTYRNRDKEKELKKEIESDFESVDKPYWSNENIDIFYGDEKAKCIKYTQGALTGQKYSFCIGAFGSGNMFQSYRDNQTSTFYFIVDKTRIKKDDNGQPDLSDPLHIVVYDAARNGVILTDQNNTTGRIEEFDTDVEAYQNYLESLGVPLDILKHRPKSEQEKEEDRLLGSKNSDLEWFINLSDDYKSKYIGRGHILTDDQFDYLYDKAFTKSIK